MLSITLTTVLCTPLWHLEKSKAWQASLASLWLLGYDWAITVQGEGFWLVSTSFRVALRTAHKHAETHTLLISHLRCSKIPPCADLSSPFLEEGSLPAGHPQLCVIQIPWETNPRLWNAARSPIVLKYPTNSLLHKISAGYSLFSAIYCFIFLAKSHIDM